jgi:hypothetical protein
MEDGRMVGIPGAPRFTLLTLLTVATLALHALPARAASVVIKNDIGRWKDTSGVEVTAESGYVTKFGGLYWWYGRQGLGSKVRAYSSTNLVDWKNEGVVADFGGGAACRPVVFFNETSGKYVLIVGLAAGTRPQLVFSTATGPKGPFTEVNRIPEPTGSTMGDLGGFKNDDGEAYVVYNSDRTENNSTVVISRLTKSTYTSFSVPELHVANHIHGNKREAFHVIKNPANNMFYLFSSKTAGWNPSATMYKVSRYLYNFPTTGGNSGFNDGWSVVETSPASANSFQTQHDMALRIQGTASGSMFMYIGDRWPDYADPGVYTASGGEKAWFPLTFDADGVPRIHGEAQWTLDLDTATWSP